MMLFALLAFCIASLVHAESRLLTDEGICDLNSIQMPPSQSNTDHPRAEIYNAGNFVERCKLAGGDIITFSGSTHCDTSDADFSFDRTDQNYPLCVPPSCTRTEEDPALELLQEAIAQQLFEGFWKDNDAMSASCTGTYEFEGIGEGYPEILQCFFDVQDSYKEVGLAFDQYQDELKEDPVNHTLSEEGLASLCKENDMDYFRGSWEFVCYEDTNYEVVFTEIDIPRCAPKSCTPNGEDWMVENMINLNFARQVAVCRMKQYSFTGLDVISERTATSASADNSMNRISRISMLLGISIIVLLSPI